MSKPWTKSELLTLRRQYPDRPTILIAATLRRSLTSVYQRALIEGLHKSAAYLASDASGRLTKLTTAGRVHRFPKGQPAWNKGMKGLQIGGTATRFKAGNRPQTWRPIGSERVDKDGIRQRKISDTGDKRKDWAGLHVLMWEKANGPVPRGRILIFKDRNQAHLELENLELVTRAELMRRNSYHTRYPKEIARLIQLKGALQRQINKREQHAKQD